jgi:hypothetical protein
MVPLAAGWHGIGQLSPAARLGALAFIVVIALCGIWLASRVGRS